MYDYTNFFANRFNKHSKTFEWKCITYFYKNLNLFTEFHELKNFIIISLQFIFMIFFSFLSKFIFVIVYLLLNIFYIYILGYNFHAILLFISIYVLKFVSKIFTKNNYNIQFFTTLYSNTNERKNLLYIIFSINNNNLYNINIIAILSWNAKFLWISSFLFPIFQQTENEVLRV